MPATLGEKRRCEKCGTDIIFLKHEKTGKLAPIELQQRAQGRFAVNWSDLSYRTVAGTAKDGTAFSQRKPGQDYWENHYLSCPEAQFFRNRTQAAPAADKG